MDKTPLMQKIESTISPMAETMGYEIVRTILIGTGKLTLQVMAEKPDGSMHIDDCSRLSQAISALLDVENVMGDKAYFLEVSSPGIDRPLTRLKDFDRYKEHEARLELNEALDGQKKFRGMLKGIEGNTVIIDTEAGRAEISFDTIDKAKLMLTDDLIKEAQRKKG